ncbi:hypothetical protein AB1Y20_002314 [Prymnesium parvum]|uniref:Uncharacterized protein n=1 Tax=Prymnesium parvum TaxID=97485 RepID=A0AB34J8R4_PRYPA
MEHSVLRLHALHSMRAETESVLRHAAPQLESGGVSETEASDDAQARLKAAHLAYEASFVAADCVSLPQVHPERGDPKLDALGRAWTEQLCSVWPHLPPAPAAVAQGELAVGEALEAAQRGVPNWLLTRATGALKLELLPPATHGGRTELTATVDGAFLAVVEVCLSTCARGGAPAWVPRRIAVGASDEEMMMGAHTLSAHLAFRDVSTHAGALLVALEDLEPRHRLPWLFSYISSLHNLFTAPCSGCGKHLNSSVGPAKLIPPAARSPTLQPFHAACFMASKGMSVEVAMRQAIKLAAAAKSRPPRCEEIKRAPVRDSELTEAHVVNALRDAGGKMSVSEFLDRFKKGPDEPGSHQRLIQIVHRVTRTVMDGDTKYVVLASS